MVIHELDRKIFRELRQIRTEVATIALLIICGITLMIGTQISYRSLKASRDHFYKTYHLADLFAEVPLAPRRILETILPLPGIQALQAQLATAGLIEVEGQTEPASGRILSIPADAESKLNRLYLRKGRLPLAGLSQEIVVHEGFAKARQLDLGDVITVYVKGKKSRFLVVGIALSPEFVYALHGGLFLPDDQHFGIFWLREPSLAALMMTRDSFTSLALQLDGSRSPAHVSAEIDAILQNYGSLGSFDQQHLPSAMFLEDELNEQRTMSIFSPLIFLSIAMFLVHVILGRFIQRQRPQIASLKALGYYDREIIWHYSKLILLILGLGLIPAMLLGLLLGQGIVSMYQDFFRFPKLEVEVGLGTLPLVLIAGLLPGMFGGYTALRSILRLLPAEALKPPTPPHFKVSLWERWTARWTMTIQARMNGRYLFHNPFRFLLTTLGLSLALAIMVCSGAFRDMIQHLLLVQFQYADRAEITVSLQRPIAALRIHDLLVIPGILQVEGYRMAPVELRFAGFKKTSAIVGWPDEAKLRQRVDKDLVPSPAPADGLVLSRYFAKQWHMQAGDRLDLRFREGRFPRISLNVSGFSDELMGTTIHISGKLLATLLDEQVSYNSLSLKVEPKHIRDIYRTLRQWPQVAEISVKAASYQSFQASMGDMLEFSVALLIGFAFLIAIGLIYNTAVVNFNESARDLATLRVLGFEPIQVFLMQLDRLLVPFLLSLIPGCWLGSILTELLLESLQTDLISLPNIISRRSYGLALATMVLALLGACWKLSRMIHGLPLSEAIQAKE